MKKTALVILAVLTVAAALAGCSQRDGTLCPTNDPQEQQAVSSQAASKKAQAVTSGLTSAGKTQAAARSDTILMQVLQNKQPLIRENGQSVYLNQYKLGDAGDIAAVVDSYALADLDGDGTKEMVIYLSPDYGAYLVLHPVSGTVYGFEFGARSLQNLKTDGSFVQSSGAAVNGYAKLEFSGKTYTVTELAFADEQQNVYRLAGKNSTREAVRQYTDSRSAVADVTWQKING